MGCIYSEFSGRCSVGVDGCDDGCIYDDDPNPADSCEQYESDWVCTECGVDMNVEECTCEEQV
jgi:hypothetical protein